MGDFSKQTEMRREGKGKEVIAPFHHNHFPTAIGFLVLPSGL